MMYGIVLYCTFIVVTLCVCVWGVCMCVWGVCMCVLGVCVCVLTPLIFGPHVLFATC